MIIYNADGLVWADVVVSDSSYRKRELKGEHKIYLDFVSPIPVDIPLGSYIEYDGRKRYTLENPPIITKQNSRNIEYKAEFVAPSMLLSRYKFRNTVDGRLKFSLTAKPHEHIKMLVGNLLLRDDGWAIGKVIDGNEKVVTYDYTSCAEALNSIAEAFETDWEIDDRTIHLRKAEYDAEDPLPLSYGKGNGFVSGVARQNRTDEDSGLEILYVCGGDQNIVPKWNVGGVYPQLNRPDRPVIPLPNKDVFAGIYPDFDDKPVDPPSGGGSSDGGGNGPGGGGTGGGGGGGRPGRPDGVIKPWPNTGDDTIGGGNGTMSLRPQAPSSDGDTEIVPLADMGDEPPMEDGIRPMADTLETIDRPPLQEPDPEIYNSVGNTQLILPRDQRLGYKGVIYATDPQGYYVYKYRHPLRTKKEGALQCDDIYPKRVGTISEVVVEDEEKNYYNIIDTTIPDNLDYSKCQVDGSSSITVIFQDGMLAGKEFDAIYDHNTRTFKIVPQEIDTVRMPNAVFAPVVGGKYIVFNIEMPKEYFCDNETQTGASWDLFRKAVEYLHDHSDYLFTFTGTLDGIWAKQNWVKIGGKLKLGGTVLFSDTQFQPQGVKLRIVSIKDYINDPHRPELELSNDAVGQSFATEIRTAASHQAIIASENNRNTRQYAKRRFNDAVATAQMLVNAGLSGFDKSISPITVQTMQMLVGAKECQFRFVTSTGEGQQTDTNVTQYWDSANNQMVCDGGILQHQTLGVEVVSSAHKASEYYHWTLNDYVSGRLDDSEGRYVYARCVRPADGARVGVGEFMLSDKSLLFEDTVDGVSVYNLLVGILNPEIDGSRSYAPMYGFSLIEPGRMVVDRLQSSDFDPATKTGACLDLGGSTKRLILGEDAEIVTDSLTIKPHNNDAKYSLISKLGDAEEAAQAAQSAAEQTKRELNDYKAAVLGNMEHLQAQIDGQIESWFLSVDPTTSNAPASAWTTTDDKEKHLGDTYTNTQTGHSWRWTKNGSAYSWVEIADTATAKALKIAGDAQTTANGKRRVFTSQPTPPYDAGDLWAQGSGGDLMRCIVPRSAGSYTASDWEKASRYTDDTAVNNLQLGATNIIRFERIDTQTDKDAHYLGLNESYGRGSGFMNIGGYVTSDGFGNNYGVKIDMPTSRQEIDAITDPEKKTRYEKIWAQLQSACGKFLTISFDYEMDNCSVQNSGRVVFFSSSIIINDGTQDITLWMEGSTNRITSNGKYGTGCMIYLEAGKTYTDKGRIWTTFDLRNAKSIKYFMGDATAPNGYQKAFYVKHYNDGSENVQGYLSAGRVAMYISEKDFGWHENPDVAEELALRDAKWRNEIGVDPKGLIYWDRLRLGNRANLREDLRIGSNINTSGSWNSATGVTRDTAWNVKSVNDWIETNVDIGYQLSGGFTISAWVKPREYTAWNMIAGEAINSSGYGFYFGLLDENSKFRFTPSNISAEVIVDKPEIGVWTHIVQTFRISGNYAYNSVYYNGILKGSSKSRYVDIEFGRVSYIFRVYRGLSVKIASNYTAGFWHGQIQDFMVWNRPLSSDEALALYNGNYLEKVMHQGSTDIKGGLVLSNVLGVKNEAGGLTGMMSGLTGPNDKVRMFFADANTSIDSTNKLYTEDIPSQVKFLIDKNGGVMMRGALVKGGTRLTDVTVDGDSILNDVRMNNVKILGNSELRDAQFFGLIREVRMEVNSSNWYDVFKLNGVRYQFNSGVAMMQRSHIDVTYAPADMYIYLPYRQGTSSIYGGADPIMFIGCLVRISNNTTVNNIVVYGSYLNNSSTTVSSLTIKPGMELVAQCELITLADGNRRIWWKRLYSGVIVTDGMDLKPPISGGLFPSN